MFDRDAYHKRMEWYLHDRFGMFIHWGLYAIPRSRRVGPQRRGNHQRGLHAVF